VLHFYYTRVYDTLITKIFFNKYYYNFFFQTEIAKRLNAIVVQILPFLSQEHQQQVASALDRAKQVTMTELNTIIGVSARQWHSLLQRWIFRRRRRREYRRRIE